MRQWEGLRSGYEFAHGGKGTARDESSAHKGMLAKTPWHISSRPIVLLRVGLHGAVLRQHGAGAANSD